MAKNRKKAEAFILEYIEKLLPGSPNQQMYREFFDKMSDAQFDAWISKVGSGEEIMALIAPNMSDQRLDVGRNLRIAKELGHEFFKRVWRTPENGGPAYLSRHKHLVYKVPIRRQAQLLVKKISIPSDNNVIDTMTGQPTGRSKGGKVSYMELQVLSAHGLDKAVTELIKYRGGDEKGFQAMNTLIARQGEVSSEQVAPYAGGVKSNRTFRNLLLCAHLESDLK